MGPKQEILWFDDKPREEKRKGEKKLTIIVML